MPNFSIPLSGLTAESAALSTIANNLANQNTTGYKNKVVRFSDLFYQNLGTAGTGDPIQVGAGAQVGTTPSLFTQGSVSATGVATDAAIQGSGFFVVQDLSGVIRYASAQVDQRKVGKLAMAIQVAFQELGVFPASNAKVPLNVEEPMPFSTVQAIENAKRNEELGHVASRPLDTLGASMQEANLTTLQAELQQALRSEIASHAVALHRESEGLVISLQEFGFFDSGSASLRPSAMPALDRIASILAVRTCQLRIEGHTDNVPIHTTQMTSNWELSTARATELVRLLITRYRFSPDRLSAAGYAQYHPIASNDTVQGRAQNRRVDVVILSEHIVRNDVPVEVSATKPSPAIP